MRLSSRTEYALLALIFLARMDGDEFVHGKEIASSQDIPMRFLQQILFSLKQARLVKSVKGKGGGYALAREPSAISIAEVIRLFDGPLAPTKAVSKFFPEETPISTEKKMMRLLKDIRDYAAKKLEGTFLSDIV